MTLQIFSQTVSCFHKYQPSNTTDISLAATVRGVDLFPPPENWLPPNCVMEVDDLLQDWTWREPFDLIHIRQMMGSFTDKEWEKVYKNCYE